MKLTFLGTRGEIEARARRHRRQSSTLLAYRGRRVLIDCGEDWRERVWTIGPRAIVITHAHPDHAFGLRDGSPCPVYATAESWQGMRGYPIQERHVAQPRRPFHIDGITFEAFTVEHSMRAPAVGYGVVAGRVRIFYAPDLVFIHERQAALAGAKVYVGDGATLTRPLVRRRGDRLIGHTPVRTQLIWCEEEGVPRAILTHCGSEIVKGDERKLAAKLRRMARHHGVEAEIAHDGMEVVLR